MNHFNFELSLGGRLSCVLLCVAFSFFSTTVLAVTVNAETVDWEPYYASTLKNNGVVSDIVLNAYKAAGIDYEVTFVPWKRAMNNVEIGLSDAVQGAFYNEDRNTAFHYSDPVLTTEVVAFYIENKQNLEYENLESLIPYEIGILRGGTIGEEFEKLRDKFKLTEYNTYAGAVRILQAGRVDNVLEAKHVYLSVVNKVYPGEIAKTFKYYTPPISSEGLYMMFSKNKNGSLEMKNKFNEGLKIIKNNGIYNKIIKEHGF